MCCHIHKTWYLLVCTVSSHECLISQCCDIGNCCQDCHVWCTQWCHSDVCTHSFDHWQEIKSCNQFKQCSYKIFEINLLIDLSCLVFLDLCLVFQRCLHLCDLCFLICNNLCVVSSRCLITHNLVLLHVFPLNM